MTQAPNNPVPVRIPLSASHVLQGELQATSEGSGYWLIQSIAIFAWVGCMLVGCGAFVHGVVDLINPPFHTWPWPQFGAALLLGCFGWFGLYMRLRAIRFTKAARERDAAETRT